MKYNWQDCTWPSFRYEIKHLEEKLRYYSELAGRGEGVVVAMRDSDQSEATLHSLIVEATHNAAIEGEVLQRADVRSSVINQLGMGATQPVHDKRAEAMVQALWVMRESYRAPLSEDMLCNWQQRLMVLLPDAARGCWRHDGDPMRIVSGHADHERVHFEAPPAQRVPSEMRAFVRWFNDTAPGQPDALIYGPVRAGLAHVFFESIHPFHDGNGRVGRLISEKALLQDVRFPALLSLSEAIERKRNAYSDALQHAQRRMDVTAWITFFVDLCIEAQERAQEMMRFVLHKSRFYDRYGDELNVRQHKVIERMFAAGPDGFAGGMSAKKYMHLTNTSKATATRDLQELRDRGAIRMVGEGRSTRYHLAYE